MSIDLILKDDLQDIYKECRSIQVSYKGNLIDAIFDSNYEIQSLREKILRFKADDVEGITNSDVITIDGIEYKVINFQKSSDGLEMIVGVER